MSFFGLNFGQNADVDIILDGQDERKMADIKDENGRKERLYLFYDGENVTGKVNITLHRKTNRLEHQGIRIEFIGQIELYYDRGNHHEFLSLVKQLAGPGELVQNTSFDFEFNQVEKPFECYTGANVRLRYFLRVTVVRRLTDLTKEMDLLVHTLATYPEMNNPIKMEVGIEECLHIEFEYNKSKYHLKDVIVGKIYFLLVRIKIKHMEVAIIKRETTGSGPNTFHDNETIAKYEIMDGAPVKGESIPIRVFLAGYDLTPTMRDVNKKFSVKYYLNLVLVDEEERRYFKQQEITLWRKGDLQRKSLGQSASVYGINYPAQHAMARHVAGDVPSQNVRTAPTPSEPNTPVLPPVGDGSVIPTGNGNQHSEATQPPVHAPVSDVVDEEKAENDNTVRKEASVPDVIEHAQSAPPVSEEPVAPIQQVAPTSVSDTTKLESGDAIISQKTAHVETEVRVDTQDDDSPEELNAPPPPTESPGPGMESPPPMDDITAENDDEDNDLVHLEEDESISDDIEQPAPAKPTAEKEPVAS